MITIIEATDNEIANSINHCIEKLISPNQVGGPWFEGKEENAENWMGDVFLDAVEYFLDGLNVKLIYVEEDAEYDEPADIDSDMGFDPYMGCFSDDC